MSSLQSLWIVIASLLFSLMGICVKYASDHMTTLELVFYRSLFGFVFILLITRASIKTLRTGNFSVHCVRAFFGFISLLLFFYAIPHMRLSSTLALLQTSPLFLALLSFVLARDRPRPILLLALFVSFAGMLFVLKPQHDGQMFIYGAAALVAGFTAGCAYYNVRRLGVLQEGGIRTVFYFTLICTLLSAVPLLLSDDLAPYSHPKLLWALAVGLTATFGQLALTRGLHYGQTVVSSAMMYSSILFAGGFEYLLWETIPDAAAWFGITLIIVSSICALQFSRPKFIAKPITEPIAKPTAKSTA